MFLAWRPRGVSERTITSCRFPDVPIKCWAYCPPGGLVTHGLSVAMQPFCTSVIVGKVAPLPRLSLS